MTFMNNDIEPGLEQNIRSYFVFDPAFIRAHSGPKNSEESHVISGRRICRMSTDGMTSALNDMWTRAERCCSLGILAFSFLEPGMAL